MAKQRLVVQSLSGLVRDTTEPAHKPEKRKGKQGAEGHQQSGKKPDLFLMFGQARFSPASVVVCHNAVIFIPAAAYRLWGVIPIWIFLNPAPRPRHFPSPPPCVKPLRHCGQAHLDEED